jgi:hypothetical protein
MVCIRYFPQKEDNCRNHQTPLSDFEKPYHYCHVLHLIKVFQVHIRESKSEFVHLGNLILYIVLITLKIL